MKRVATLIYTIIEIYDEQEEMYNYYLEKEGFGDLCFLYGTKTPCVPIDIACYIGSAEECMPWE